MAYIPGGMEDDDEYMAHCYKKGEDELFHDEFDFNLTVSFLPLIRAFKGEGW